MRPKHKIVAIGILLVLLTVLCVPQLQAQEEGQEMTLQEFVDHVVGLVQNMQSLVEKIAEAAAKKSEVRALETRVAALETVMPWPTATPTTTPTPTPFPDESRNFAHQLAVADHAKPWGDFFDLDEDEQERRITIYQDYFVKTAAVCGLDFAKTFALLQKYAEPIDSYSPPHKEVWLQNIGMGGAGWRYDFISRIATNTIIQGWIRDDGCDDYLDWYT